MKSFLKDIWPNIFSIKAFGVPGKLNLINKMIDLNPTPQKPNTKGGLYKDKALVVQENERKDTWP